jgi:hypothetical protein
MKIRSMLTAVLVSAGTLAVPSDARADAGIASWEELGPGNTGCRIRSIVAHPTDADILYLGSCGGGVWKTTNAGASWFPTDDFMGNLQVSCLAMDPQNPNVLYAGTGEGFAARVGRRDGKPGDGVYRTANGGLSWTQLTGTVAWRFDANRYVNRVTVSPEEPDSLLVATDAGIQRSIDGGDTFTLSYTGRVTDVRFHPTNGKLAVAGLDPFPSVSTLPAPADDLVCALYSTLGGEKWASAAFLDAPGSTFLIADVSAGAKTIPVDSSFSFAHVDVLRIGTSPTNSEVVQIVGSMNSGPVNITIQPALTFNHSVNEIVTAKVVHRTEVAWAPSRTDWVYASMGAGGGSIWRSIDNGATYTLRGNPVGTLENYLMTPNGGTHRAWYNNLIWVAPDDEDLLVVGGLELFRSSNGGSSVTQITARGGYKGGTNAHADHHVVIGHRWFGLMGDPDAETIFAGNDGGIQRLSNVRSATTSAIWTNLAHDLGILQLYAGAASGDGSALLAASQDTDLLIRQPAGGTNDWLFTHAIGDALGCAVDDRIDPPRLYRVGNGSYRISMSTDWGTTLVDRSNTEINGEGFVRGKSWPFLIDPNNFNVLYAGFSAIWRSPDGGNQWAITRTNRVGNTPCSALEVTDGDPNRIWAGYDAGLLSYTTNSPTNWVDVAASLPSRRINDIAVNPLHHDEVYIAFASAYGSNDPIDSVWFSSDNGVSWTNRSGAMPHQLPFDQVNSVTVHPTRNGWLYAGTDVGLYASEDRGLTWSRTPLHESNEGPANTSIQDLFWDDAGRLYAATYGRGLFRATVQTAIYVDGDYAGPESGTQSQPFNTVQEGVGAAANGTDMYIHADTYDESGVTQFDKRGDIRATDGTATIR